MKKAVFLNYITQIYISLIALLMYPLYLRLLGAESYGLIGFYTTLQTIFSLLDLGLTPTISRETARYRSGVVTGNTYLKIFKSLRVLFFGIAIVGFLTMLVLSDYIAKHWLNYNSLKSADVLTCVICMAFIASVRWVCGLYRGIVTGSENFEWFSKFNLFNTTFRFVLVVPFLYITNMDVVYFFIYQCLCSVIEFSTLLIKSRQLVPSEANAPILTKESSPFGEILKFSFSIAFTSSVWIVVTQLDKIILSGLLSLDLYGYFSAAVLAASSITLLTSPVSSVIMPRLTSVLAKQNYTEASDIYLNYTKFIAFLSGSIAACVLISGSTILEVWTGNTELANRMYSVFVLYSFGNTFLAVGAFPYYYQYAKGNLKYHLMGSVILLVTLIPSIIVGVLNWGAIGAAAAWCAVNFVLLITWYWFVHSKIAPGIHCRWIVHSVFKPMVVGIFISCCLVYIVKFNIIDNRSNLFTILFISMIFFANAWACDYLSYGYRILKRAFLK